MLLKTYNVFLSDSAKKDLLSFETTLQERTKDKLKLLKINPFPNNKNLDIKKIKGFGKVCYRLRVGNYRIIYYILNSDIKIVKILHRKKAYKWI